MNFLHYLPPIFRHHFSSTVLLMLGWSAYVITCLFFLLMLNWQHSANALYLLLSVVCLFALIIQRVKQINILKISNIPVVVVVSLVIYPLALLFQSVYMNSWSWRAWDTLSRFILGVPIIYFLAQISSKYLIKIFHFAVLGTLLALVGALEFLLGDVNGRAMTYFMHPTAFGDLVLILGILSLGVYQGELRQRIWAMSGLCAGLYASYLSGTRAVWVAAILIFTLGVVLKSYTLKRVKLFMLILFLFVVTALYAGLPNFRDRLNVGWYELTQPLVQVSDTSVGLRRQYWAAGLHMISEHPLVGVGRFQFPKEKQVLIDEGVLTQAASQYDHPHNELLFAWAELGLLGLIGVLCLYLVPGYFFWNSRRSSDQDIRRFSIIGLMVVLGYMVFGLVDVMMVAWVMQAPVYVMSIIVPMTIIFSRQRLYMGSYSV